MYSELLLMSPGEEVEHPFNMCHFWFVICVAFFRGSIGIANIGTLVEQEINNPVSASLMDVGLPRSFVTARSGEVLLLPN